MRIIAKPGGWHRSGYGLGYSYPRERQCKGRQRASFIYKESVEVPGMGPGESCTGVFGNVPSARRLLVKRDLEYRLGAVFKGTSR